MEKPAAIDGPKKLENLPSEIKMMILKLCDFKSIRSIVRASPAFHSFYLSAREELLTLITIRQLNDRGFDMLGKYNILEAGGADESIGEAATNLYRQCRRHLSTNGNSVVRLDVQSSLVLLSVRHAMGWRVERLEGQKELRVRGTQILARMYRNPGFSYEIKLLSLENELAWGSFPDKLFRIMIRDHRGRHRSPITSSHRKLRLRLSR